MVNEGGPNTDFNPNPGVEDAITNPVTDPLTDPVIDPMDNPLDRSITQEDVPAAPETDVPETIDPDPNDLIGDTLLDPDAGDPDDPMRQPPPPL